MQHSAFYISDGTAITAEVVGHATLSQFELEFTHKTIPFIESIAVAEQVKEQINSCYKTTGKAPLVFFTFVDLKRSHRKIQWCLFRRINAIHQPN